MLYNEYAKNFLPTVPKESIACVVTSPRYNVGKDYGIVHDRTSEPEWMNELCRDFALLYPRIQPDGLVWLNLGDTKDRPMKSHRAVDAICQASGFILIERIIWVKSITIPFRGRKVNVMGELDLPQSRKTFMRICTDDFLSFGHYTPISSDTHFHPAHEFIFVLAKMPNAKFFRKEIGVPYTDKSNVKRYGGGEDVRALTDVWFIDYETTGQTKKKAHTAQFPLELPRRCIKASPYGTVYDPYAGSCQTGIAASQLDRTWIATEADPKIFEQAKAHLKKNGVEP